MFKLSQIISRLKNINQADNNNDIYPNQSVTIGENCRLKNVSFGKYNAIGQNSFLLNVQYGAFSYNAQRGTFLNCRIGKFCSIAQNVGIGLGIHPVEDFVSTHPAFYSTNQQCGISFADQQYFDETGFVDVGNDVWIGADCIILDNVKIGDGAIIAANSVVTKDVPSYAIVGGTPAKIIKYRFLENEIEFLNNYKWWDKEFNWLKENFKSLHNIKVFMEKNK